MIDTNAQEAEYAAWSTWRPESQSDKRDAHCHGFDAGQRHASARSRAALDAAESFIAAASTRPDDVEEERQEVLGLLRAALAVSPAPAEGDDVGPFGESRKPDEIEWASVYLPLDCPRCGRHRLEYGFRKGVIGVRCEKCGASSDADTLAAAPVSGRRVLLWDLPMPERQALERKIEESSADLDGIRAAYVELGTWFGWFGARDYDAGWREPGTELGS